MVTTRQKRWLRVTGLGWPSARYLPRLADSVPKVQQLLYIFSLQSAVHSTVPPHHLLLSPPSPSIPLFFLSFLPPVLNRTQQNTFWSMGSRCCNTELHAPFRAIHFSYQAIVNTSGWCDPVDSIAMRISPPGGTSGWLTGPRWVFLCIFTFVLFWDILQESFRYAHQMNSLHSVRESCITKPYPQLLWLPDTSYSVLFLNLLPISYISATLFYASIHSYIRCPCSCWCGKMCSCQGHFDIVYYCHRFLISRMILSHIYNSFSLNIFTPLQSILYIFFDF